MQQLEIELPGNAGLVIEGYTDFMSLLYSEGIDKIVAGLSAITDENTPAILIDLRKAIAEMIVTPFITLEKDNHED